MTLQKQPMPFSDDEYLTRLARTKKAMADSEVECFVVTDSGNICYLSGFTAESAYVAQALVVFAGDEYPTLYLRRQDAPAGMYLSYMPNEHIVAYPEHYIGDYEVDGFDFIFDRIADKGQFDRIGLEFDAVSGSTLDKLRERLGNNALVDLGGVIVGHRLIKSEAEIELQRQASLITDAAMQVAVEAFEPGKRECEVAAEMTAALIHGTPEYAGHPTDTALMPGGLQSGTSHIPWTERHVETGRHYNIEFGAARYRYNVGLMRTVCVGEPSAKLKKLYPYMIEGCNTALDVVKSGATCADVANAYCDTIAKGGYEKDSRCGYPIGINWLETSCSLRTDDPTVLTENMVFHLMLGTWLEDDFGAIISETFRVTESGCEVFSTFPRELIQV